MSIKSPAKLTIIALALSGALVSCNKQEAKKESKAADPVVITVAPARLDSVQRSIEVVGTLYGDEEAVISAKVAGRISKVMADMGDRIAPGAPLAQIDPTDWSLACRQAETGLQQTLSKLGLTQMPGDDFKPETTPTVVQARVQAENADARFHRVEKLFKQDPPLISEQDYADAKTAAAVAQSAYDVALLSAKSTVAEANSRQADLRAAEQRLSDTLVRAPQSGTAAQYAVATKLASVGEYVKDGTALFKVVADNPIRFRASVPERYLSDVKLDQSVTVQVEAYASAFTGKIKRINPQVDRESRAFMVEIVVDNAKGQLRPGAFARGSIATTSEANVTFVPQEAIISFAGIRKVFTVKEGKAVEHEIAVGVRQGNLVEITKGLEGAPEVVMSGASKLAGGTAVQLKAAAQMN